MGALIKHFWVSPLSLKLIYCYLSNRTQRIKINKKFSEDTGIEFDLLRSSVLGPLLFNIDTIDHFYECEDSIVSSFADDTAPYSCATDIPSVTLELQNSAAKLFSSFKNNHFKGNLGKSYILPSTKKPEIVSIDRIPPITASSWESHYRVMSQI